MNRRDHEAEADRLVAAAVYLMTCHARNGCPRLACMIQRHLQIIGRHPGATDQVREIAQQLSAAWSAIRTHDERIAMEREGERARLNQQSTVH